jgi:hypothetical protein
MCAKSSLQTHSISFKCLTWPGHTSLLTVTVDRFWHRPQASMAHWNDDVLTQFDNFVIDLPEGWTHYEWFVFDKYKEGSSTIDKTQYACCKYLSGGRYGCGLPCMTSYCFTIKTSSRLESKFVFSALIKSMRNDSIECAFGILKGWLQL